jgi:hypothetical protein
LISWGRVPTTLTIRKGGARYAVAGSA